MPNTPLVWDTVGEREYETGVSNVALYPFSEGAYKEGVAWSGITGITESPSGAEASPFYADNIKYFNLMSNEDLSLTVEAYMYPDEFAECDGSGTLAKGVTAGQQTRKPFGLVYKTIKGNDTESNDHGYKIHLIYGCLASPSEMAYSTVNDSPEPNTMSWSVSTTPVSVAGMKPTARVIIDSTKCNQEKLAAFEKIIYGSSEAAARLPLPSEVATLMAEG